MAKLFWLTDNTGSQTIFDFATQLNLSIEDHKQLSQNVQIGSINISALTSNERVQLIQKINSIGNVGVSVDLFR